MGKLGARIYSTLVPGMVAVLLAATLVAQQAPPRAEIYGGYRWENPGGKFGTTNVGGMGKGFDIQSTFNFTRYFGFTIDTAANFKHNFANVNTIMFGPTLHSRNEKAQPFVHALFGWQRVQPSITLPGGGQSDSGFGTLLGGGLDIPFSRYFSWRAIQGDYLLQKHDYPTAISPHNWNGGRLGSGIVVRLGSLQAAAALVPAAVCAAQPAEILAGEPVTVTATPSGFKEKSTLTYSWSATGGKVGGNQNTTQVDTAGLAPGAYSVTASLSSNKKQTAGCSASFTVKEKPAPPPQHPPTISCSANPATVRSGEPSLISCNVGSPDNRPVTTSFRTSGGRLTPSGNQATLDTAGAPTGPITVAATATDDRTHGQHQHRRERGGSAAATAGGARQRDYV